MADRATLLLRAGAANVTPVFNDSVLEQRVLYAERIMTAKSGTGTTQAADPTSVQATSGAANV